MRRFMVVLILLMISGPAFAGSLTEQAVKDYLQSVAALYSAEKVDQSEVVSFIKKHIADDAAISVKTEIEGVPEAAERTMTKSEIVALNASSDMETFDSSAYCEMNSFEDIGDDKSKVTYTLWLNATIKGKQEQGKTFYVDYKAESACEEIMTQDGDTVKILKSACQMKASYGKPYGDRK